MTAKLSLSPFVLLSILLNAPVHANWETLEPHGECNTHEECGVATVNEEIFVIGGRNNPPVNKYNPQDNSWSTLAKAPFQIHHFQAIVLGEKIALLGGFTGDFPREKPVEHIWYYIPETNTWEKGPEIPKGRRRGAAGVTVYGDHVYLVCGIVDGHYDGHVTWLDRWNWKTGEWEILADAPHARDHFQTGIVDGLLIAAGGRRSSAKTGQVFDLTVSEVDVYDIASNTWTTLEAPFPTPRAGTMALAHEDTFIIAGGESMLKRKAHKELSIFEPSTGTWREFKGLDQGRHGGGMSLLGDTVYISGGNGGRGGRDARLDIRRIDWSALLKQ